MSLMGRLKLILAISFCILGLDIFTKRYVVDHIPFISSPFYPFGGIGVFRKFLGIDFCINHVTNTGAAWGMFSAYKAPLMVVRLSMISALTGYFFFAKLSSSKLIAVATILAGAIGNVLDYSFYGHVIDMFHFRFFGYEFPIFNVADSFIFLGILYLTLDSYLFSRKKEEAITSPPVIIP